MSDEKCTKSVGIEYYTVNEVAKMMRVSPSMVYKLIYRKQLPVVRIGKRLLRIPSTALPEGKPWTALQ